MLHRFLILRATVTVFLMHPWQLDFMSVFSQVLQYKRALFIQFIIHGSAHLIQSLEWQIFECCHHGLIKIGSVVARLSAG